MSVFFFFLSAAWFEPYFSRTSKQPHTKSLTRFPSPGVAAGRRSGTATRAERRAGARAVPSARGRGAAVVWSIAACVCACMSV